MRRLLAVLVLAAAILAMGTAVMAGPEKPELDAYWGNGPNKPELDAYRGHQFGE